MSGSIFDLHSLWLATAAHVGEIMKTQHEERAGLGVR